MIAHKKCPALGSITGSTSQRPSISRRPHVGNRALMVRDDHESLLLSSQMLEPRLIGAVRGTGLMPDDYAGLGHAAIQRRLYADDAVAMESILSDLRDDIGDECDPEAMLHDMLDRDLIPWWHWRYYVARVSGAAIARAMYTESMEALSDLRGCPSIAGIESRRADREAARIALIERLEVAL